jgi:hypothetical protein
LDFGLSRTVIPKYRDLRLDLFRGLALLFIFVAHMPGNLLAQYRPGVFGFSDSADIFVFVSGYAAAMAYGKIFSRAGFLAGTARVVKRCGELYSCHLGLFFSVAVILVLGNRLLDTNVDYVNLLNLEFFFDNAQDALVGLFTLTYVPNYFDILPMYLVALAMLPPLLLLARVHKILAGAVCVALYLSVFFFRLELPAEITFHRPWFFNPFAWQMLFYTGFCLGAGYIRLPQAQNWLVFFCAVYVILCIPLSHFPTYSSIRWLNSIQGSLEPFVSKTNLGILRWLHLLALAYLSAAVFKNREHLLQRKMFAPFIKTGQQALPVFLMGMVLAHVAGMAMDELGRTALPTVFINVMGAFLIIMTAYTTEWFKSQPWRAKPIPEKIPTTVQEMSS